ncbi:MAG TPA: ADP-glyceromanno-heptose 6-epimerase [Pyrinomonadaceae bacterium]|nr:ADP-glyceromanno-heptose 6-epimerase [Chloracidobacterium sp.]HBE81253.1 ADP-glyceromanno-heptose 6-epimerase [Blastocatellia bacterium]HRJ88845.1 ADP-glyceromanno-heptose 6-epimerase [Pyrinomonadaceae bacterium]HRK48882.1 ADP-glyceromanno-heptose 6-epimerase [Pyrinomonadaceae bacterium]
MSKHKIIVTGGAGFIGSAVVSRLNELGYDDILIVDSLDETDKWKNLVPLRFADYIDAYDLMDDLDEFKDADVVFHLGACSSTTETDADYMIRNNYQYTQDLARWSVKNDIRFIYASSAATYGDGSAGMDDGTDELNKLRPLNIYGYSKHLFDRFAARNGMFEKIVGLKYFNVFGPNESHKGDMRSLVNKAFEQINSTGTLQLFKSANPDYADGEFGRDFVYVKDAVEMTLHFLENDARGLFNVGSGRMNTWNALADAIFKALDRPRSVEFIDMPEHLRDRYQYHTQADLTRIREAGYTAETTPLDSAVADYVRNYLVPGKHLGD